MTALLRRYPQVASYLRKRERDTREGMGRGNGARRVTLIRNFRGKSSTLAAYYSYRTPPPLAGRE